MYGKCYLVYRRNYFIGDNNGVNVGQYIVSEREYYNDQMIEHIKNNYADILKVDSRALLTSDESQAYYQCVRNNLIINAEIEQELEHQILYNLYNNKSEVLFDE